MNDEYLWQKTGEDPETMQLENALAVFRYREVDPPAVPVAVETKATRPWRRFALAFAVPAFAAAVVASVIWLPIGKSVDNSDVTFVAQPEPAIAEPPALNPAPVVQPSQQSEPSKQPIRKGEIRPTVATMPRRPIQKARPQQTTNVALTQEERYAYQQLLLALSISSSKLKIAQDAVNGVENPDSNQKHNNR